MFTFFFSTSPFLIDFLPFFVFHHTPSVYSLCDPSFHLTDMSFSGTLTLFHFFFPRWSPTPLFLPAGVLNFRKMGGVFETSPDAIPRPKLPPSRPLGDWNAHGHVVGVFVFFLALVCLDARFGTLLRFCAGWNLR